MMPSHEFNSEVQLCSDDQRLLDALVEAGFDRAAVGQLNEADGRRMDVLVKMLGLMQDYPVDDAEDTLIDATLARINRHERDRADRMRLENQREAGARSGRRIRVPDFISVAAVLLIGVSVGWPVLKQVHNSKIDRGCADNMRQLGYAFGNYAADYNEALPVATAGFASWDRFSNVLNLNKLVENGYCDHGHLDCPGHEENDHMHAGAGGPSYSYRWFVPGAPVRWSTSPRMTVVLGDLNPVIDSARSGIYVPPLTMSPNHAGRGQYVLMTDASSMWLDKPIVGSNDNIWLPNGQSQLLPGQLTEDPLDVFLAH